MFGQAARTEFFGGFEVRSFYGRINKTQLSNGEKVSVSNAPEVYVDILPVAVVYGAAPRISLIAIIPTINRSVERTINNHRISESNFGIGDAILLGKYRFYKKDAYLSSRPLAVSLILSSVFHN